VFGQTGLTVFEIDSGVDLIVKTHKKNFPSYHCFRAQRIHYITIAVCSYEYGAEKILSLSIIQQNVSHTAMRAVYPYVHTLIKSMPTISCTTVSVERCLSKMAVLQIYLRNHRGEERLNCSCSDYIAS